MRKRSSWRRSSWKAEKKLEKNGKEEVVVEAVVEMWGRLRRGDESPCWRRLCLRFGEKILGSFEQYIGVLVVSRIKGSRQGWCRERDRGVALVRKVSRKGYRGVALVCPRL